MTRLLNATDLNVALERLATKPAPHSPEELCAFARDLSPATRDQTNQNSRLRLVGDLLQGERLTAEICQILAPKMDLLTARSCLLRQEDDERLHAKAYRVFLQGIDSENPPRAALGYLKSAIENWQGPPAAIVLATQLILESEALALQSSSDDWSNDPGLGQLHRMIARDEARHVAFARLYLPAVLATLSLAERRQIFEWLRKTWRETATLALADLDLGPLVLRFAGRRWARRRWRSWHRVIGDLGLFSEKEKHHFQP